MCLYVRLSIGKTTLLNVLAGRASGTVQGSILVDAGENIIYRMEVYTCEDLGHVLRRI